MKRPVILYVLASCVLFANFRLTPVLGQSKKPPPATGKIVVLSPHDGLRYPGKVKLRYFVTDADITSVTVKVDNGQNADTGTAGLTEARVFLFSGKNTINLAGYKGSELDTSARAAVTVVCDDECITDTTRPPGGMVQSTAVAAALPTPSPASSPAASPTPPATQNVRLFLPSGPVDGTTVDARVLVEEKSGIKRLVVDAYNNGHRVGSFDAPKIEYKNGVALVPATVNIAEGDKIGRAHV